MNTRPKIKKYSVFACAKTQGKATFRECRFRSGHEVPAVVFGTIGGLARGVQGGVDNYGDMGTT